MKSRIALPLVALLIPAAGLLTAAAPSPGRAKAAKSAPQAAPDTFARDVAPLVALPIAYREPRRGLVERGCGIAQAPDNQFGRTARPGLELVAKAAGDRLTIIECNREIGAEPVIGARRAGVPARPDDRVAAPEQETKPGEAECNDR